MAMNDEVDVGRLPFWIKPSSLDWPTPSLLRSDQNRNPDESASVWNA